MKGSGVRFAPSPTGRFHIGNLRTAWISREWAKKLGVPWVVRFEDIDRARGVAGAMEGQLADMKALGLIPDRVDIQSQFHARHVELFERARAEGRVYPCSCSRKEIQAAASAPHGATARYSGKCRVTPAVGASGWRFKMNDQGDDFVVARTAPEFAPSYHWACAIDDGDGDFDLLVRAWDLESAAPIQAAIQKWAGLPSSPVFHAALVTQDDGSRLEKRTLGVTLDELFARGETASSLLERFATSADFSNQAGETRKAIRLSELGLS